MTMLNRLNEEEQGRIVSCFEKHPLMLACQRAFLRYQANMLPLMFAPEEVFFESAFVIDEICELPHNDMACSYLDGLWNRLRIKIGKWERMATCENLDMAVSSIFFAVAFVMSRHWTTFYNCDVFMWLMHTIAKNMKIEREEMLNVFSDMIEYCDEIEEWINTMYDGCLSQEIDSVIRGEATFLSVVTDPRKCKAVVGKLHALMEGKTKPKDVVMPIRAAMDVGVIRRPTYEEFSKEFGEGRIKAKSSYNEYTKLDKRPYTGDEYGVLRREFERITE